MLSLYTLKSAQDALTYYQQGDYYTQGGVDEYSQWWGKGAERLELRGAVEFNIFQELLEGRLPNGILMTQVKKGAYHRPGYDLTFSAPKSVSILALVAKDERVLAAHRTAVQSTLSTIESKFAGCRNKKQGVTSVERTQNFTIATFEHSDSRAGDPNLHIHCVLLNITQRADKEWRTLLGDEFYQEVLLLGKVYDSYLAQGLMQQGFELELGEQGYFEIKAVPEALIHGFSKRRMAIENWLETNQLSGSKAAEMANLMTRAAKVHTHPEERQERWLQELKSYGVSLEQLTEISKAAEARGPLLPPDPVKLAESAVDAAVNHLSEHQNHFSFQEVIKTAKRLSLLLVNEGDLLQVIEQKIANNNLLYLENRCLTTSEIKQLERQNCEKMQQGQNSLNKLLPQWMSSLITAFKTSQPKVRETLMFLLSAQNRQVLLSSNSKALLNKVLQDFMALGETQKYYPRILTQRTIAIEPLKKQLQTERIHTIEEFLLACEQRAAQQKEPSHILEESERRFRKKEAREVWVMHEAISAKQLNRLGNWAETLGARIVLTTTKPSGVLEPLKRHGIAKMQLQGFKAELSHLKRQRLLLKQLDRLVQHQVVQEVPDNAERLEAACKRATSQSLIIVLTQAERAALNVLIREQLKQANVLKGEARLLTHLYPISMSLEEKSQPHLYQPGDILRFNQALVGTAITQESYFTVQKVHLETREIVLIRQDTQVLWNPNQNKSFLRQVEVFRKVQSELQVGDIICWNRTVREKSKILNRIKGQRAIVTTVHAAFAAVKLQNGCEVILKDEEFKGQHWDYGYAMHVKDVGLHTAKELILVADSRHLGAKNLNLITEILLTARMEKIPTQIICNDLRQLKETIRASGYSQDGLNRAEVSYKRAEALQNYQQLATQPLFNRLQSEYLKVSNLNPEFSHMKSEEPLSTQQAVWTQIEEKVGYVDGKVFETLDATPELRVACDVVDRVSLYHFEREAVFGLEDLKKEVVQIGALIASIATLEKAVNLAVDKGWLISVGQDEQGQTLVTAKHTLAMEQFCIVEMQAGKNQLNSIIAKDSSQIQEIQNHLRLTQGQKQAIELVLTTPDRIVAVQGIAGAGKTTALKEINRLCEAQGFKARVLANTASAKNQAKQASNMTALTVAQFLTRMEAKLEQELEKTKQKFGNNSLYIVDESSLVSTKDAFRLQKIIRQLDARLTWMGDFKQQGSIGAGLNFQASLAYGINKVVMQENVRLNDPIAFTAMKQAYAGDMVGSLQTLQDSIEEIPVKEEALERIVTVYTALSSLIPELLVIIPRNQDRHFVNQNIREKLKECGRLAKTGLTIPVFVSTDKREIDKSDIFSYRSTDVIRFNTSHARLNIEAGDYADILDIDLKHQRLTLKIENKLEFYWSPKDLHKVSNIEIYKKESRELVQNDIIVFKRNQEKQGIFNGDKAVILKIESDHAEVLLANGNTVNLDLTQKCNQHLDYGYALTTYAAQGKDVQFVIAYGEGPKARSRKAGDLKVGDVIVLPKEMQPQKEGEYAKVVVVNKISNSKLTLQDRSDQNFEVKLDKKEVWRYFPPIEQLTNNQLPLSTSQQSFIINITRGNGLLLVVPNIEGFQKTLELYQQLKRSALSYADQNWEKLNAGVNRLVENIQGKVAPKDIQINFQKSLFEKTQTKKIFEGEYPTNNIFERQVPEQSDVYVDKDLINRYLESDILGYASQWLGQPKKISGNEARWQGALTLNFRGPKAGLWKRWSTGEGGKDLISLYMAAFSVEWKVALKELASNLGLNNDSIDNKPFAFKETKQNKKSQEASDNKKIAKAKQLYYKGVPIAGTLAEQYLREHRGITGELPKDFKFIKATWHLDTKEFPPALLAPIRDKNDQITGVVRIFLNQDSSKYSKTYIDENGKIEKATTKANLGISSSGAVTVQRGVISTTLWVAEGIETALSIAEAKPNQTVMASLSVNQFKNIPISPEVQKVVICADNDSTSSNTKANVIKAVESFLSQGLKVFIALPTLPKGMDEYDFNDLLKSGGISAVQKDLGRMVEIKDTHSLKTPELRLEADLNKIRLEKDAKKEINIQTVPKDQVNAFMGSIKAPDIL